MSGSRTPAVWITSGTEDWGNNRYGTVVLEPVITVYEDQVYHIVVYSTHTPDSNNYVEIRRTDPLQGIVGFQKWAPFNTNPFTTYWDPAANVLEYGISKSDECN